MVLLTQSLTPLSPPRLCITLQVFDAFSPRLTDRNSKVNLHALEAFSNIVPLLGNMLVPIVNNVVTALVPNLASRNPTIHSTAMTVLDLLSQCIGKEDTTEVLVGNLALVPDHYLALITQNIPWARVGNKAFYWKPT